MSGDTSAARAVEALHSLIATQERDPGPPLSLEVLALIVIENRVDLSDAPLASVVRAVVAECHRIAGGPR